jgi:hypothetical protein
MQIPYPQSRRLRLGLIPVGLAALAIFLIARIWHPWQPAAGGAVPISPQIEQTWGIRVTQLGVTADGGMVDFRYIVLDPTKAHAMLANVDRLPVLIAEDSQTLVNSAARMDTKHDLTAGRTYFLLYRNTHGAIQPGTAVTVKLGELQLAHVIAR